MKQCNQCGKCCVNYSNGGLTASEVEIEYWDNFRPDIYRYVSDGKIWVDPDSSQQIERCPWLREVVAELPNAANSSQQKKYSCDIYHDRPDDCRYYPVTIEQMIKDECEMLEDIDLVNPKQSQKKLDRLMADSRPPLE